MSWSSKEMKINRQLQSTKFKEDSGEEQLKSFSKSQYKPMLLVELYGGNEPDHIKSKIIYDRIFQFSIIVKIRIM